VTKPWRSGQERRKWGHWSS